MTTAWSEGGGRGRGGTAYEGRRGRSASGRGGGDVGGRGQDLAPASLLDLLDSFGTGYSMKDLLPACLYLLYSCPHRRLGGAGGGVGVKDLFKAFRAVKCKTPEVGPGGARGRPGGSVCPCDYFVPDPDSDLHCPLCASMIHASLTRSKPWLCRLQGTLDPKPWGTLNPMPPAACRAPWTLNPVPPAACRAPWTLALPGHPSRCRGPR